MPRSIKRWVNGYVLMNKSARFLEFSSQTSNIVSNKCSLRSMILFSGWKGTWVCEADKGKALEMYKEWKSGVKAAPAH